MWILGIDTCTETLDAGLLGDEVGIRLREQAPRRQLTRLIPMIGEILEKQNLNISDIDLIAVTNGPGSFTGIRLGLATVKTLAQVNNIPLAPVNTLDALACGAEGDGLVIPIMDARKNEVFYALYEKKGERIARISRYRKANVDDLIDAFNNKEQYSEFSEAYDLARTPPLVTGSVFFRYRKKIDESVNVKYRLSPEETWTPNSLIIARIGKEMADQGKVIDYMQLEPKYMRKSDARPPKVL